MITSGSDDKLRIRRVEKNKRPLSRFIIVSSITKTLKLIENDKKWLSRRIEKKEKAIHHLQEAKKHRSLNQDVQWRRFFSAIYFHSSHESDIT